MNIMYYNLIQYISDLCIKISVASIACIVVSVFLVYHYFKALMCLIYIYMIEKQIYYIIYNYLPEFLYIQTTFSKCELFF